MGLTNNLGKLSNMITSTGSAVGIGISSPTSGATLDVYNATQGNLYISSAGTNDGCLRFFSGGNELVTLRSNGAGALRIETGTGSPAERIRVTATGNVGIGTASPATKLDVVGTTRTSGTFNAYDGTRDVYLNPGADFGLGALPAVQVASNHGLQFATNNGLAMYITSGRDVGIGSAGSSSYKLQISKTLSSATSLLCLDNATNSTNDFGMDFTVLGYLRVGAIRMVYPADNNLSMVFYTYNGAGNVNERMRITNGGNFLVGQSVADIGSNGWQLLAAGGGHTAFAINNNEAFIFNNRNTGTTYQIDFRTNSIERGSINVTDSGTTYTTTSDYRVKEDFKDFSGLEKLSNIKVYDFKFKDLDERMDGVIAHELQEVLPYAVYGEKDGSKFQGVDYSRIVPVLIKAIQEQQEIINQLSAKVTALENK